MSGSINKKRGEGTISIEMAERPIKDETNKCSILREKAAAGKGNADMNTFSA